MVKLTASHALKNNDPALNKTAFRDAREQEDDITLVELTRDALSLPLTSTQFRMNFTAAASIFFQLSAKVVHT